MIDQFNDLVPVIQSRLLMHHRLYPSIPVKAEYWESLLVGAINECFPEKKPQWDCGSQQIGRDITLNDGLEISCKAGQLHSKNRIKISSSTLSRFGEDYDMMKEYISTRKTEDFTLCLSNYKHKKGERFNGKYIYSLYSADAIDYTTMVWEEFGKDRNLRATNHQGVTMTITKAMGWQVWYYLPLDLAINTVNIEVNDNDTVSLAS